MIDSYGSVDALSISDPFLSRFFFSRAWAECVFVSVLGLTGQLKIRLLCTYC